MALNFCLFAYILSRSSIGDTMFSSHHYPLIPKLLFLLAGAFILGGQAGKLHSWQKSQATSASLLSESTSWGLSFQKEGERPVGNATINDLDKYHAYYAEDTNEKKIYLTFDAGYENGYTNLLLDTLKKHNAPANFFVVKSYIENNKDLVNRMVKEGHLVCNHSKSHVSMASIDNIDKFNEEILSTAKAYKEVTGKEMPKYFRPPMGKFSERSLKYTQDLGYSTIFWSFAYVDWYDSNQPSHEEAKKKIYSRTHPGAIVLLHSNSQTNAEILDEVLTHWEEEGYTIKSLDYLTDKKTS